MFKIEESGKDWEKRRKGERVKRRRTLDFIISFISAKIV